VSIGTGIRAKAIGAYLGPMRSARRKWNGFKRIVGRQPRRLTLYHQVDDPHGYLMAQALAALLARFDDLVFEDVVVPVPAADADPEPQLRAQQVIDDAVFLSRRTNLVFPDPPAPIADDRLRRAQAILLKDRPAAEQLDAIVRVGDALWRDDGDALAALVKELDVVPGTQVRPMLEANYRALRSAGHYQGSMIAYGGEWYWGVDRLKHLTKRLVAELGGEEGPLFEVASCALPEDAELTCWLSFRSPYSYLGAVLLQRHFRGRLNLRPVLPMVTRGLAVPRMKRLYIARDAKREADRLEVPFGKICDPLGEGVERCMAVFFQAETMGRGLDFYVAAGDAIWARGVDVASDAGLAEVAAEVGIEGATLEAALADRSWEAKVEANREALVEAGLWGVPSFVWSAGGETNVAWGQDRLEMVLT